MCQVAAPLLPLTTEAVYRGLVGDDASVHLTDWPTSAGPGRVAGTRGGDGPRPRRVQCVVSGSQGRGPTGAPAIGQLDHRGPRRRIAGAVPWHHRRRDQRQRRGSVDRSRRRRRTSSSRVVPAVLGPRVGKDVQKVIAAVKQGEWTQGRRPPESSRPAASSSREGEYSLRLVAADPIAGDDAARQHRCRRARHRPHSGARGRGCRPRSGAIRAAGPARCRPARQRPHRAPPRCTRLRFALRSSRSRSLITEPTLAVSLTFDAGRAQRRARRRTDLDRGHQGLSAP